MKNKQDKRKKRYIFRSIVLAVLVAAVAYALYANLTSKKEIIETNDPAPDFQLAQINENNELDNIRISDLEGKGIMLNFWGTWCKPCEAEMPFMEELYPKYKDGVEIVAVSLDTGELAIHNFIDKHNLSFPVLHDNKGDIMDLYNIGPIPSTYFINPDGVIVDKVEGALTLETLEEKFQMIAPN